MQTSAGALHTATEVRGPVACTAEDGPCLPEVERRDDLEYTSVRRTRTISPCARRSSSTSAPLQGRLGVVLAARNSLVTTYVFYQALAYAGRQAGDVLAALERGEPGVEERVLGMARELGGIEVLVSEDGGAWREVGSFGEAGPIAADRHVVPLGEVDAEALRVKLRMAKGSWRIDEVALATLGGVVEPVAIEPDSVTTDRPGDPRAAERLADPEQHLVTVPGDAYRLWFTVPDGGAHELLLDTRGYYYEWTREGWLPDESAARAALAMLRPREALRLMAPGFKAVEGGYGADILVQPVQGRGAMSARRFLHVLSAAALAWPVTAAAQGSAPVPVTGSELQVALSDGSRLRGELIETMNGRPGATGRRRLSRPGLRCDQLDRRPASRPRPRKGSHLGRCRRAPDERGDVLRVHPGRGHGLRWRLPRDDADLGHYRRPAGDRCVGERVGAGPDAGRVAAATRTLSTGRPGGLPEPPVASSSSLRPAPASEGVGRTRGSGLSGGWAARPRRGSAACGPARPPQTRKCAGDPTSSGETVLERLWHRDQVEPFYPQGILCLGLAHVADVWR